MDPQVTAAIIAASVSGFTLVGTLAAQYLGLRASRRDTKAQFTKQSKQLDGTLAEQRKRTLNERFATAAGQLGNDMPAVRLAGVYAMAGLADDWPENRQSCVDVLCDYLRLPYDPDPGHDASAAEMLAFRTSQQVRHTVIRVIAQHLRKAATASWQALDFDFAGVVFDGGDLMDAVFSGGIVSFIGARFVGGTVRFDRAVFSGGRVLFDAAEFSGSTVRFDRALFSAGQVSFLGAVLNGGELTFNDVQFSGGEVSFDGAQLARVTVRFDRAQFSGSKVSFRIFTGAGSNMRFVHAEFSGGTVVFPSAAFSGGTVNFYCAKFSGGEVSFEGAQFSGGRVSFSGVGDWSRLPKFNFTERPPTGLTLPPGWTP